MEKVKFRAEMKSLIEKMKELLERGPDEIDDEELQELYDDEEVSVAMEFLFELGWNNFRHHFDTPDSRYAGNVEALQRVLIDKNQDFCKVVESALNKVSNFDLNHPEIMN